ncbi:hypothetical protein HZS_5589, partial [Henneguya salminicola]
MADQTQTPILGHRIEINSEVLNLGFLRPDTTTLPQSLRGVDLINLNPPTIANSNFALILAFFYTNLVKLKCASLKMAEILAHYGFGNDLSCLFQNVESAKTILPHRERKDATLAASADAAKQSNSAASESVESLRYLAFATTPSLLGAANTLISEIPSDVDYTTFIEESYTTFQAASELSRAPRSKTKHFAMAPRKSEAGLLSQIAALRNKIAAIDREIAYRKTPGPFTEARRRNFYKFRHMASGVANDDLQILRFRLSLELKASGHMLSLRQKEAKT